MSAVADGRRMLRASRVRGARAVKRAGPLALPLMLAALVAAGWAVDSVALAIVLALELALAGLGTAALLGAVRPSIGYARYAILAVVAVSITLAGRQLPDGIGPLAAPVAWAFLWWTLNTERKGATKPSGRLALDLFLVLTVFATAAGLAGLFPEELWLLELVLLGILTSVACLRAAEARGALGVPAVGHAALHLLVVLQVAAAHGHRRLVLGAWGCGVFGNDPDTVAEAFAVALYDVDRFDHVAFAVLDRSGDAATYHAFAARLGARTRSGVEGHP